MKMIQSLKLALIGLGLSCSSSLLAQEDRTMISGLLTDAKKNSKRVVLVGTNSRGFLFYKENPRAADTKKERITSYPGIWLFEPKDVTDAKNLYESRKYKEALNAFKKLQVTYADFKYLNDSYFETAEYYEMECYRKLKDYKTLTKRLETYRPDRSTRPSIIAQTKIYKIYDAIDAKDWRRLQTLCDEYIKQPGLTLSQRTQLTYGLGMAYEGQDRSEDALNAYATAMTMDFNRSETIVRDSALRSLGIFATDREVAIAATLWKSDDEDKNSDGYRKLGEANALARLYDNAGLGFGVALPSDLENFKKFTSDVMVKRIEERGGKVLKGDIDGVESLKGKKKLFTGNSGKRNLFGQIK